MKSDRGGPPPLPTSTRHGRPPKRRRGCLCRCFCWTVLLLVLLVIIVAATVGVLYLVFRPKLPKYDITELRIGRLEAVGNDSVAATFDVNITAHNPNEKIGIYYEGGSKIGVWYYATELCTGALPKFYQGHENTTVLSVPLAGQADNASGLLTSIQTDQQQLGHVPLVLRVRQPVRIRLGKLKLFKVKFVVRCRLSVADLSPNNSIRISDSSCRFRLRL